MLCSFGGLGGLGGLFGFAGSFLLFAFFLFAFFASALDGFPDGRGLLDVGFVEGPLVGDVLGQVLGAGAAT